MSAQWRTGGRWSSRFTPLYVQGFMPEPLMFLRSCMNLSLSGMIFWANLLHLLPELSSPSNSSTRAHTSPASQQAASTTTAALTVASARRAEEGGRQRRTSKATNERREGKRQATSGNRHRSLPRPSELPYLLLPNDGFPRRASWQAATHGGQEGGGRRTEDGRGRHFDGKPREYPLWRWRQRRSMAVAWQARAWKMSQTAFGTSF